MAITTTTAPDARNTRLRISVRLAAARWAAILSRADPSLLVLLALPMACLPGFLTAGGCSRPSGPPLRAAWPGQQAGAATARRDGHPQTMVEPARTRIHPGGRVRECSQLAFGFRSGTPRPPARGPVARSPAATAGPGPSFDDD